MNLLLKMKLELIMIKLYLISGSDVASYSNVGKNLTSVPADIPDNVNIINLSNNLLQNLTLGHLDSLQKLDVSYNNLNVMPVLTHILSTLKVLKIARNNIATILVNYFDKTPALEELDLKLNHIREINLEYLIHLISLNLSNNELQDMPRITQNSTSLRTMVLDNNGISQIPQGYFENIPSLHILKLSSNPLISFECTGLFELRELRLSRTNLNEFPNITDCFTSLEMLFFEELRDKLVKKGIEKSLVFRSILTPTTSQSLKRIELRSTFVGNLPSWFLFSLPNLEVIDIAETNLTEMPDLSSNTKLLNIRIQWNENLKYMNMNIFANLNKMQYINMRGIGLRFAPDFREIARRTKATNLKVFTDCQRRLECDAAICYIWKLPIRFVTDTSLRCGSSGTFEGTKLTVYYGHKNSCHPCTTPPEIAAKTINEFSESDACGGELTVAEPVQMNHSNLRSMLSRNCIRLDTISDKRVIFKLVYSKHTWLKRQTIMLKGENLTCTNYAKSAPLQVYYEYVKDCNTYKPCKAVQESVNKTNCTYSCTCPFDICETVFVLFNEPQYSSLCDIVFLV